MGLLTQKDARLFRGFFKEMARLRGIPVTYRYAEEVDKLYTVNLFLKCLNHIL